MPAKFKAFSDYNGTTVELGYTQGTMRNAEFAARFPGVKGMRSGGFDMRVGLVDPRGKSGSNGENWLPVTRYIQYKHNPSLHECNAKCMGGKHNGACECRCGGKNHGLSNHR